VTAPDRAGLTDEEAALLWAVGRFGGGAALLAGLGEEVSQALAPRVAAVAGLEEAARAELLEGWEIEDRLIVDPGVAWAQAGDAGRATQARRLDARWQGVVAGGVRHEGGEGPQAAPDGGVRRLAMRLALAELVAERSRRRVELIGGGAELDPGWFGGVVAGRLTVVLMRVGVFQLVESLRAHDRRDLARLLKELPEPHRGWALADLKHARTLDPMERARVLEVFVAMSKRHERWEARTLHAGLYFVAASAGRRLASRLSGLSGKLPGAYEEAMWEYHRALVAGSRRALPPLVRRSLGIIREELEALAGEPGR
jgi:hypothetical protein